MCSHVILMSRQFSCQVFFQTSTVVWSTKFWNNSRLWMLHLFTCKSSLILTSMTIVMMRKRNRREALKLWVLLLLLQMLCKTKMILMHKMFTGLTKKIGLTLDMRPMRLSWSILHRKSWPMRCFWWCTTNSRRTSCWKGRLIRRRTKKRRIRRCLAPSFTPFSTTYKSKKVNAWWPETLNSKKILLEVWWTVD